MRGDGDRNGAGDDVTIQAGDGDGDVGGLVHLSVGDVTDPELEEVPEGKQWRKEKEGER